MTAVTVVTGWMWGGEGRGEKQKGRREVDIEITQSERREKKGKTIINNYHSSQLQIISNIFTVYIRCPRWVDEGFGGRQNK